MLIEVARHSRRDWNSLRLCTTQWPCSLIEAAIFQSLQDAYNSLSVNGPKMIFGDLNSRLHHRLANEHHILGPNCFGDSSASFSVSNNRSLLMETCESLDLCISNILFDHADELLVTYWGIGSSPMAHISHRNFAQLDLCLIDSCWRDAITDVRSLRHAPLNSHHFLVVAKLAVSIPKTESRARRRRHDLSCLRDLDCAMQFSDAVKHWMDQLCNSHAIDCHDICSVDERKSERCIRPRCKFCVEHKAV